MKIRQTVVLWGLIAVLAPSMVHAQASTLADGTVVHVRLTADLLSSEVLVGSRVDMEIAQPVALENEVLIPEGSAAWGEVRAVRRGKILDFDIVGARLPNGRIVLLRCSPQRTTKTKKDEIKVEIRMGRDLGAPKGIEYTAYLDQDLDVDLALEPLAPAQPTAVAAAAAAAARGLGPRRVMKLGDDIRGQLVFDEGDAIAQLQLALLQALNLDDVGAR